MALIVEIFFYVADKDLFIFHSQYDGYWQPGDARAQGASASMIFAKLNWITRSSRVKELYRKHVDADIRSVSMFFLHVFEMLTKKPWS